MEYGSIYVAYQLFSFEWGAAREKFQQSCRSAGYDEKGIIKSLAKPAKKANRKTEWTCLS